jgi:macrolide transport system ATP-binding/permease protein
MMHTPILKIRNLRRQFSAGDEKITALDNLNLDIFAGEMVAIMGASGSGKSTLMNILGCLDQATEGSYEIDERETSKMTSDELAELRSAHFGFIFQRYHLLSDISALGNVEVPAIYAGHSGQSRHQRAKKLLTRLGMSDRIAHKPNQLSGGQQQRVSIARALMNGGEIILADEPTGALDTTTGAEVMRILQELHEEGHTIILVTHDAAVAQNAQRIIELRDGIVVSDKANVSVSQTRFQKEQLTPVFANSFAIFRDRFTEAFRLAWLAMINHRLRTFLTMLGIIIGISSVVTVVALGNGSQQQILKSISSLGTNTIDIYPGESFGDTRAAKIQTLRPDDAKAIAQQSYVDSVTPSVATSVTARFGNVSATAQVTGVGEDYFRVRGLEIEEGSFFLADAVDAMEQSVVIDNNTRKAFFDASENPIGQVLLLGSTPCRVIGVTKKRTTGFGNNENLSLWVPYTTAMGRMLGQSYLRSITVRIRDDVPMNAAEEGIGRLMTMRHGEKDFYMNNSDNIRKTVEDTTNIMKLLISSIALISLVVGGIGVMNIMLVSVVERTGEIGIRMAVGARQNDIQQQFLIEAVMVCLIGGILGVLLAFGLGLLLELSGAGFSMIFSMTSVIVAFACSSMIGVAFGFLPARHAAKLNPVEALARE